MKKIQFQQNQITLWNNKLSVAYFRVYIEIVKYTESTEYSSIRTYTQQTVWCAPIFINFDTVLCIYTHTHTVDVLRVGGGGIVGTLCAKRIYYDLWCQRVWDAFGCGGNDDTCTAFFSSFFLSSSLSAFHAENKLRQKVSNFGAISFLFYFSVLRAYLMILQTHFLIQWRFHFSIQFWYWCRMKK